MPRVSMSPPPQKGYRLGTLFAALGFLGIGMGSYLTTHNVTQGLLYGIGAIFVLGFLGHKIGYIISNPAGQSQHAKSKDPFAPSMDYAHASTTTPITGDEVFLKEVGISAAAPPPVVTSEE